MHFAEANAFQFKAVFTIEFEVKCMKNKKTIFIIITSILCVAIAVVIIVCCVDWNTNHTHQYRTVTTPATCLEEGQAKEVCDCGDVKGEVVPIPALGHDYVDGVCSRCQKTQTTFEVKKVEFLVGKNIVDQYEAEVFCEDFKISALINDGADLTDCIEPKITWTFEGDAYGSSITQDGVLSLADFIGNITIRVTVESTNIISATLPISVISGSTTINSISVTTNEGYTQSYIEGDKFDANSIAIWGEYPNGVVRIYDYTIEDTLLTPDMTEFVIEYDGLVTELPIVVSHKTLKSIEIVTEATKKEYLEGQPFVKDGLVVRANFENSSEIITDFIVDETTELAIGTEGVPISYTHNGVTKIATHSVTVIPKKLMSISVDASKVRTIYTQGNTFNPKGLIVKAEFETFGEIEISDYTYTQDVLTIETTHVVISYTVADTTKTEQIAIEVVKPYTEISQVKVLSPSDISILWSYSYMTDSGIQVIDNTAYEANSLVYDKVNGLYDIPLGAVVTATIRNPSVVNVALNGLEQTVNYDEKTITWTMGSADLVVIKSIEMSGSHSVIRFAGQDNEQSFLYEGTWNGCLTTDDLQRLALVFADTDDFYHTYIVDGVVLRYEDLTNTIFDLDSVVTVVKNSISINAKEIILHLGNDASYSIFASGSISVQDLPVFTKSGYNYGGWALSVDGERVTDEELLTYLSQNQGVYNLYIIWIKETVDYSNKYINPEDDSPTFVTGTVTGSGSSGGATLLPVIPGTGGGTIGGSNTGSQVIVSVKFVGTWEYSVSQEGQTLVCSVTFNADGSFEYKVIHNEIVKSTYTGAYRLSNDSITVLFVETTMNIPLPDIDDFNFTLGENSVLANIIIAEEDSLIFSPCELTKATSNDDNNSFEVC